MPEKIEAQNVNPATDRLAIPGTSIRIPIVDASPAGDGYYNITTNAGDLINLLPDRKLWIERIPNA